MNDPEKITDQEREQSTKEDMDDMMSEYFPESSSPEPDPEPEPELIDEDSKEEKEEESDEESKESEDDNDDNKDKEEDKTEDDDKEDEDTKEETAEEDDKGDERDEKEVDEEEDEEKEEEKEVDLEAANELLRQQIEAMAGGQQSPTVQSKEEGEEEEEGKSKEKKPVVALPDAGVEGLYTFVTDEEADELDIDPTVINKLGNQIYQLAVRNTLLAMPSAVKNEVRTEMRQEALANEFYNANKDLTKYKQFVGVVANQLIAEDPNMKPEVLFGKLGNEVRNRLGLSPNGELNKKQGKISKEGTKKRKPAFAKSRSSKQRKVRDDRSELETEIDDIIEIDERNV